MDISCNRRRRQQFAVLLSFSLILVSVAKPVFGQQSATYEAERLKARIDAAVLALGDNPRFKTLSAKDRQGLVEFVAGNMLFVLLHELGHAAVSELGIIVLGKEEDAADSFAASRLIRIGNNFSDQVVADSAKGWFMSDRRDKKEGDAVPFYDEHGLDLQRPANSYAIWSAPTRTSSSRLPMKRSCRRIASEVVRGITLEPRITGMQL